MPALSKVRNPGHRECLRGAAEVNALAAQGKDIVSFCIGQPDFRRRCTGGGHPRHPRGHGYTPAGIDPCARRQEHTAGSGGPPIRAQDVVVGGRRPHARRHPSSPIIGAGEEVIYPNPPDLRIADRCRRRAGAIHASKDSCRPEDLNIGQSQTKLLPPPPAQPDRRGSLPGRKLKLRSWETPQVWVYADEIYSRPIIRASSFLDAQARHVRAHQFLDGLENLGDDRLAHFRVQPGARAGADALDHLTDSCASQISRAACWRRSTARRCRRNDEAELPRARPDQDS